MFELAVYKLKKPFHFFKTGLWRGLMGQIKYGFPARKLNIITISGTDGKTTSATLLYHLLKAADKRVALLSTVAAYIDHEEIDTGLHVTSPDPFQLHRILRQMVDAGIKYVVLEVTSHGAYQYRTWGIHPVIAGVTNITREHLDYHLTQEEYIKAKAIVLKKAPLVVLNQSDDSYYKLKRLIHKSNDAILTYSDESKLPKSVATAMNERFSQPYNWMNTKLVYTIAKKMGIPTETIAQAITSFPGVSGRMQVIPTHKPFTIIVDFAHTPQALKSVLSALRHSMPGSGRLIAVFGCAGLRDRQKRPVMGEIAANIADISIFTAEDPRTEDVWAIIRQMKERLDDNLGKVISIPDRREAIAFALTKIAKKGDVIGIFGKGHERSMCYGTTEYPWSDELVVKEILKA